MGNINNFLDKVNYNDDNSDENLVEFKETCFLEFDNNEENIDFENGVIKNISLLSSVSKNKRTYPVNVLEECIELAEGVKVFADHPELTNNVRSVKDLIGKITDVYLDENSNILRGNLHVIRGWKENLFDIAENMPDLVGMSINALGAVKSGDNGYDIVEKIIKIISIDLVSDPATTFGVFEQDETDNVDINNNNKNIEKEGEKEDIMDITLEQLKKENREVLESYRTEILDSMEITSLKENYKKIKEDVESFESKINEMNSKIENLNSENETLKSENEEGKVKTESLEDKNKELEIKVEEYEIKETVGKKRGEINTLIEDSKLPDYAVTDRFVEMLMKETDAEVVKALINERKELLENAVSNVKEDDDEGELNPEKDIDKKLEKVNEDDKGNESNKKGDRVDEFMGKFSTSLLGLTEEELETEEDGEFKIEEIE